MTHYALRRLADEEGVLRTRVRQWLGDNRSHLEQIKLAFIAGGSPHWPSGHSHDLLVAMVDGTLFGIGHEQYSLEGTLQQLHAASFADRCARCVPSHRPLTHT